MTRTQIAALLCCALLAACGRGTDEAKSANAKAPSPTPVVTTAAAMVRQVSANVQSTGSFVALESSDVAPDVAGRIVATEVNVGDSVQAGQTIARLDDREASVKLQQAEAALQQAEAAVRQAQSRIGLAAGETFDPNKVPEVLCAKAAYESAAAQAKLAQADATRYENLVDTGDVSRSAYDKAQTQVDTAQAQLNAARQQYEGDAQRRSPKLSGGRQFPGLARSIPRRPRPRPERCFRYDDPRALRRIRQRAPRRRRRVRRAHRENRDHFAHRAHQASASGSRNRTRRT